MRIFIHRGLDTLFDATPEQIQKVMNLYMRPGTPGEKAAAGEALRRMGVDPDKSKEHYGQSQPQSQPRYSYKPKESNLKMYKVTYQFTLNGEPETWGPDEVNATDELDAEAKIRKRIINAYRYRGKIEWKSAQTRRA